MEQELGPRLRARRMELRMPQREVAEALLGDQAKDPKALKAKLRSYQRWEAGGGGALDQLDDLARVLRTSKEALLLGQGSDNQPPPEARRATLDERVARLEERFDVIERALGGLHLLRALQADPQQVQRAAAELLREAPPEQDSQPRGTPRSRRAAGSRRQAQ